MRTAGVKAKSVSGLPKALKPKKLLLYLNFMKAALPILLISFILGYFVPDANAQTLPEPRQSPIGVARAMMGDTYIKVMYGRPSVRDREIFGSLVPFGEVWRTGANEATEITVSDDILIEGERLEKGTYSLFTIPEQEHWTVIVNRQLGQWGSYSYDKSHDVLRLEVPVAATGNTSEIFTISFEKEEEEATEGHLVLAWENSKIELHIAAD